MGTYPPYFGRLREVNRRGPAVYGPEPPALTALTADEVRRQAAGGARLVDARPLTALAAGHIPGALSIPLRDAFATWLGWLADPGEPLVFVLDDSQDRADLVLQALKIGYEHLAGELAGGMPAWTGPTGHVALVPAGQITGPVLDIRQDAEYGPLTLICGHGDRAMSAASLLADDWAAATGRPLRTG